MFDSSKLAARFGLDEIGEGDAHLLLQEKIRLFCTNDKLVLVTDGARRYAQIPAALWEIVTEHSGIHLLITRSGDIALQLMSSGEDDDQNDWAAATIAAVLPMLLDLN